MSGTLRLLASAMAVAFLFLLTGMSNAQPLFEDVSAQMGLNYTGTCGYMFWCDFDNDGDLDLMQSRRFSQNTDLYRNDGDHFTLMDVGLPRGWDIGGFIPMDWDHDGDMDVFFPSYHNNSLAMVNENGVFQDHTSELGFPGISSSRDMKWVDFDRDGWMDLLYGHATMGFRLFRNTNGLVFSDVTASTQLPDIVNFHRTCETDVDLDGDMDLFTSVLGGPDHFFVNQGNGVFTDETESSGLFNAQAEGGCAWVDFDHDKYPDLLTQSATYHTIWHNNHDNTFTEMIVHGTETDFFEEDYPYAADYAVADFDMDGDYDFYACRPGGCGEGLAANQLFIQDAQSDSEIWFHDIAPDLGMDFLPDGCPSVVDFDNDGDLDLSITVQYDHAYLYRNNTNSANHMQVRVLGPAGEQDRWLTRVELYPHNSNTAIAVSELNTSNVARNGLTSYFVADENAHYDLRLYFACGTVMTPEDYPYLADIVPSQIGHLLTVYMASPTNAPETPIAPAAKFRLDPGYPNPFNASTTISYSIAYGGAARLTVYNIMGQAVADLINGMVPAGEHRVSWNAIGQASGLYFVQLTAGGQIATQKIILLK